MNIIPHKECTKCKIEKPLSDFYNRTASKDGKSPQCISCARNYHNSNAEHYNELSRKYYREKVLHEARTNPISYQASKMLMRVTERAKNKGLELDNNLTKEWFEYKLQERGCECCGVSLNIGYKGTKERYGNSPSIDRINPLKGYTIANTAILCWDCNRLKNNASSKQLRAIADWLDSLEAE